MNTVETTNKKDDAYSQISKVAKLCGLHEIEIRSLFGNYESEVSACTQSFEMNIEDRNKELGKISDKLGRIIVMLAYRQELTNVMTPKPFSLDKAIHG